MSKYRPSFAQNQLHKHGWETGKGLGKSENGIKSAIKVKVKNNKGGLGHDAGSEFTFHWWDHIFNKAANAIEVVNDAETDEVSIQKNENAKNIVPQLLYNKKPLAGKANGKPLLYGTFVSAGTVTPGCDSSGNTPELSSESESESDEEFSTDLLDRTYKKTGLTGHKGARHGLKLSGKLKRIQDQESSITDNSNDLKTDKEKKKKKKRKNDEKNEMVLEDLDIKIEKKKKKDVYDIEDQIQKGEPSRKKKKKKKKNNE